MKTRRINFWLSEDLIARLQKAKAKTGMSVVEFVRRALDETLKGLGL